MRKVFIKRAKSRSILAYFLLTLSLIIIVGGIFLAVDITTKFSTDLAVHSLVFASENYTNQIEQQKIERQKEANKMIEITKYKYTAFLVTLLSMLFFISQTLLRLYRYNILKADFYITCADSLILSQKFDYDDSNKFETLLNTMFSEKISLSTPQSPSFSVFSRKDKEN